MAAEPAQVDEVTRSQVLIKFLTDTMWFARQLRDSVPVIGQLLGSKSTSDVTEAIDFFLAASKFQVNDSILGSSMKRVHDFY